MARAADISVVARRFPMLARAALSATPHGTNKLRILTYLVGATALIAATALLNVDAKLSLFVISVLFGWSEVNGLCGSSHLCTLTPVQSMRPRTLWLKAVAAYTGAGVLTSALIGALLSTFGQVISVSKPVELTGIAGLALVLGTRELGLFKMSLPQVRRQTNKMWAFEFGIVPAAAMWGAHIGLAFATVIRHGGFFVVVAYALVLGPVYGTGMMVAYWLGRAMPLWAARVLFPGCGDGAKIFESLDAAQSACGHVAALGLFAAAGVAIALVLH